MFSLKNFDFTSMKVTAVESIFNISLTLSLKSVHLRIIIELVKVNELHKVDPGTNMDALFQFIDTLSEMIN